MGARDKVRSAQFARLLNPLLAALRELGGTATPQEVRNLVAARFAPDRWTEKTASGQSRLANQFQWARFYLANTGYIDRSRRGVWALTDRGTATRELSALEIDEIVKTTKREPPEQASSTIDENTLSVWRKAAGDANSDAAWMARMTEFRFERATVAAAICELRRRFDDAEMRVHLATTNIRDVVHKRLLKKKPNKKRRCARSSRNTAAT